MRYSARATQNHASCARMDACRRYIFADCANISVEAGSETFAWRTWRKVSATMRQTVFNFIEMEREWLLGFHLAGKYCTLPYAREMLYFVLRENLKETDGHFRIRKVIRYRALLAKSRLKNTRSIINFLKVDYNSREKMYLLKKIHIAQKQLKDISNFSRLDLCHK